MLPCINGETNTGAKVSPCVRLVVTLIKSSFIEQRAREE
jgi:hypothetical protein